MITYTYIIYTTHNSHVISITETRPSTGSTHCMLCRGVWLPLPPVGMSDWPFLHRGPYSPEVSGGGGEGFLLTTGQGRLSPQLVWDTQQGDHMARNQQKHSVGRDVGDRWEGLTWVSCAQHSCHTHRQDIPSLLTGWC